MQPHGSPCVNIMSLRSVSCLRVVVSDHRSAPLLANCRSASADLKSGVLHLNEEVNACFSRLVTYFLDLTDAILSLVGSQYLQNIKVLSRDFIGFTYYDV